MSKVNLLFFFFFCFVLLWLFILTETVETVANAVAIFVELQCVFLVCVFKTYKQRAVVTVILGDVTCQLSWLWL